MTTPIDLGRPLSGDVIELILHDHQVDADCGSLDNVRRLVTEARASGLLDGE